MSDNYSPVVLFTYNRLEHTKKTIQALKQNFLAENTILYIYSDAGRSSTSVKEVGEVRSYLKTITGFKEVIIIYNEVNAGLSKNIISGVTAVVDKHRKVIVLEDDIITSKYFLKYMNDALAYYENKTDVWQVSSHLYPVSNDGKANLINLTNCWGWATWDSRWKFFEKKPEKLIKELDANRKLKHDFTLEGRYRDFYYQVKKNALGEFNTWAIFWYATVFKHSGLTLYPDKPYSKNIGFDGTGQHCNNTQFELNEGTLAESYSIKSFPNHGSPEYYNLVADYLSLPQKITLKRIVNKIKRLIS